MMNDERTFSDITCTKCKKLVCQMSCTSATTTHLKCFPPDFFRATTLKSVYHVDTKLIELNCSTSINIY